MFFIGPSVNIFVYLLVSAFFVICFYPQNETRFPEVFLEQIVVVEFNDDIDVYQIVDSSKNNVLPQISNLKVTCESSKICPPYTIIYDDYILSLTALRAPPIL